MNISRNLTDSFHYKKGVVTRTLPKFRHAQPIEQYNIEKRHIDAWKKGWTNETSTHHDGNGLQTVVVVVIVVVFLPLRLTVYQISVLWNFNFNTGNKYIKFVTTSWFGYLQVIPVWHSPIKSPKYLPISSDSLLGTKLNLVQLLKLRRTFFLLSFRLKSFHLYILQHHTCMSRHEPIWVSI